MTLKTATAAREQQVVHSINHIRHIDDVVLLSVVFNFWYISSIFVMYYSSINFWCMEDDGITLLLTGLPRHLLLFIRYWNVQMIPSFLFHFFLLEWYKKFIVLSCAYLWSHCEEMLPTLWSVLELNNCDRWGVLLGKSWWKWQNGKCITPSSSHAVLKTDNLQS